MNKFLEKLEQGTLVIDGAMGTMLHARGVGFDKCFDELNITNPAAVADIHREYIEVPGAQLVITNTFGANRYKLSKHGLQNDVVEIKSCRCGVGKKNCLFLLQRCLDRRGCRSAGSENRWIWQGQARGSTKRVRRAGPSTG